MLKNIVLHSNIDAKERVSIREEDLDKLTKEDWAELNRRNVHVCIIPKLELFSSPSIYEKIYSQIEKSIEEGMLEGTRLPEDLIQFE